jgi:hypothetical protein
LKRREGGKQLQDLLLIIVYFLGNMASCKLKIRVSVFLNYVICYLGDKWIEEKFGSQFLHAQRKLIIHVVGSFPSLIFFISTFILWYYTYSSYKYHMYTEMLILYILFIYLLPKAWCIVWYLLGLDKDPVLFVCVTRDAVF